MSTHFKLTPSRLLAVIGTTASLLLLSAATAWAAVTNPVTGAFGSSSGAASGELFTSYFITIWKVGINLGGLLVLVQFASGSFDWMTSNGDKGKLETARGKMIQAAIGIIILVSLFTIIGFFSNMVFGKEFNLLKLTFGGASSTTGGGSGKGGSGSGGSGGSGSGGSGSGGPIGGFPRGCGNIVNNNYEFPANSYQCFDFDPAHCKYCNGNTGLFEDAPNQCPATSHCAP